MSELPEQRSSNLLPCPLCGCDDLETSPWPANRERSDWVARCGNPDCGCEVRAATATECAAKWNRRRSVEPPAASVIPREPSHEMMQAGLYHSSHDSEYADVHSIWVNMWDKAAGASEPPDEWQPIATAPKDGRRFLAVGMGPQFFAHWGSGANIWQDDTGAYREPRYWKPMPEGPCLAAVTKDAAPDPDEETPCPRRDDGLHCECWYGGNTCCACGDGDRKLGEAGPFPCVPVETSASLPCVWRDGCRAPAACAAKGHCDGPFGKQVDAYVRERDSKCETSACRQCGPREMAEGKCDCIRPKYQR